MEEQWKIEQRLNERNLTSLNMNSEQRLNQYKQHIGKLDENVEKNMEYHKQYLQANMKPGHKASHDNSFQREEDNTNQYSNQYLNQAQYNDINKNQYQVKNEMIYKDDRQIFNDQPNYNARNMQNNQINRQVNVNRSVDVNESNKYNDFFNFDEKKQNAKINHAISNQDFGQKNSKNYQEYFNAKRDILNFNKNMIDNKMKQGEYMREEKRKIVDERLRELENNRHYENEMKRNHVEQQNIYRNMLDGQKLEKINSPIANSMSNVPPEEHYYQYKNNSIPIAPFSEKKYEFGGTQLDHNPILNPVPYYKNNKYLYKEGANNSPSSSLRFVGNNIIG